MIRPQSQPIPPYQHLRGVWGIVMRAALEGPVCQECGQPCDEGDEAECFECRYVGQPCERFEVSIEERERGYP